jgi:hypothetical protein
MTPRDRLLKRDPLRLVTVRKTLKIVAECLSDLDASDADRYLGTLVEELEMLKQRETSSIAWQQATSLLDHVKLYGLDRIGFRSTESGETN